ncbi:Zn-dependent hydrolase [Heyndrickxia ginsengihumi]|uniref:Zn-dependent hydrolase n=1 Tax=Heyndrickxia ginsengihumi TaxID=363870 RepID=UPI000470B28E|nr:Zn-dependent hydrolase [Heyndrickxia ginsengihumi]
MNCELKRLQQSILKFSHFGKSENGGVTRLTLTQPDVDARTQLIQMMEEINLRVSIDDLGNIYGTYEGKEDLPPIILGSHGDSVEKGGNFDGILGILGAYEVVKVLHENQIRLRHPIVVADFTNEEGVRFGPAMFCSGVLAGVYEEQKIFFTKDRKGITFQSALEQSGFNGLAENRLKDGTAYLELHIEQGPVLEALNKNIGVVEGIVGMNCLEIIVRGQSNHAGTTPMQMRKDPLMAAAHLIDRLNDFLRKVDEELVFTIGQFDIFPNLHTVIPDQVKFTFDVRHKSEDIIKKAMTIVEQEIKNVEEKTGCTIFRRVLWERETVIFDNSIVDSVETSTTALGYSYKRMYSGAGHDAQFLAKMMPTGMIFVPSKEGKSHCEEEYTSIDSCTNGVNVLLQTVLDLDKKLN